MIPYPLSAVIITRDAAEVLGPCLASLGFADEILLVDSGSRDQTIALAQNFNARVIHQQWLGFGQQKRFAVERATHPWVLCIDADERVTEPLKRSILQVLTNPGFRAYRMARCNRFLGRWLRHGEGYPDWNLRLFHRDHAQWSVDAIHEKVETALPVGRLAGDLNHESEQTLAAYLEKQHHYTTLQAARLVAVGWRIGPVKLVLSPLLRFIKFYFLRLGFLDGTAGLIHIGIGCCNSFMKYAKARELMDQNED